MHEKKRATKILKKSELDISRNAYGFISFLTDTQTHTVTLFVIGAVLEPGAGLVIKI